tara:strand:+ start:488 stop:1327 length:840 start_codon:yes stop_codon:yes gene_type:complete
MAGTPGAVGADTVDQACTTEAANPNDYISTACVAGDPSTLGADAVFSDCTDVTGCAVDETCTSSTDSQCTSCTTPLVLVDNTPPTADMCVSTAPYASCLELLTAEPTTPSGMYTIDVDGLGPQSPIMVHCDMTTDGGGYTTYRVTGGINTVRSTDPNSCTALGMQMVVARTNAHWQSMFARYPSSFATVPGVSKPAGGGNYTSCAMNSATGGSLCNQWDAVDGGAWFVRATPFGEPNGDYTANCWMGRFGNDANGMFFNDLNCGYATGPDYICSTNDKP